jgi:hypothetical protein
VLAPLLSILVPGSGHVLFGPRRTHAEGVIRIGIDFLTVGMFIEGYRSMSSGGRGDKVRGGILLGTGFVLSAIHRIECANSSSDLWDREGSSVPLRTYRRNGLAAAGLSLLFPGAGHFYLNTRASIALGIVHTVIESASLAVGGIFLSKAMNFERSRGLFGNFNGAAVIAGGIILPIMILHRIGCAISCGLSAPHVNRAERRKARGGLDYLPRVSLVVSPRNRTFGTSLSWRF